MKSRPIYSIGAAISVIVCLFAELAFSSAFRQVYAYAGNSSWLCVLVAGMAVTALLPVANRCNVNLLVPIVGFIYLSLYLYRMILSSSMVNENRFIILVLICAVILSISSAYFGMRGAGIYSAMSFIPVAVVFFICCILGVEEYEIDNVTPMFDNGISGIIVGTFCAFSLMSVVLIPAILIEQKYKRCLVITGAVSTLSLSVSLFLGSLAFGKSAVCYHSIVSEISKNVSVGKFFQRLEGLADVSYILSATAALVLVSSLIGVGSKAITAKLRRVMVAFVFACIGAVVAYSSIYYKSVENAMRYLTLFSGIAIIAMLIVSLIKVKKVAMLAMTMVPVIIFCSCNAAGEIENQTYVVVTCYDSSTHRVAFVTENGSGTDFYSVAADDILSAAKSLEVQKSLSLSFEQMGLLLLSDDCENIFYWIDAVITSDIPNSVALYISDSPYEDIYSNQISKQASAFDYVSSLISSSEREKLICRTVSKVKAMLSTASSVASVGVIDKSGVVGFALIDRDRVRGLFDATESIANT